MKKLVLGIFFLASGGNSFGQTVPSSCTAPDSIMALFREDAYRLTVLRSLRNNLPQQDSILIGMDEANKVWKAMIAVYNAVSLPARDSVIRQFEIHTSPSPSLTSFSIIADSTLPWMQQLGMGNIPTGTPEVDSLLIPYGLKVNSYFRRFGSEINHWVYFKTDSFYNTRALAKAFEKIQGVSHSEPEFAIGDGNYMIDSIYNDHVELIYSLGWGDCPAGCIHRRFWKFNVYNDCSVEYMGSYGDVIEYTGIQELEKIEPLIYPNPFTDELRVEKIDGPFIYTLIDEQGRIIMKGSTNDQKVRKLNTLLGGLYYLRIESRNGIYTTKLMKLSR